MKNYFDIIRTLELLYSYIFKIFSIVYKKKKIKMIGGAKRPGGSDVNTYIQYIYIFSLSL